MNDHIQHAWAKFLAAVSIVFTIDFLTNAGKVAGALLSIGLFGEWVWKRLIRPRLRDKRRDPLASTMPAELKDH